MISGDTFVIAEKGQGDYKTVYFSRVYVAAAQKGTVK